MLKGVLLALLLLTVPAACVAQSQSPAPSIALRDLKGRTVRLKYFQGKIVLLNFWATWCPPCKAEMVDLVKLQRAHRSKGLQVIGVTYPPTNRREVLKFIRAIKVNYPVLLGSTETKMLFDRGGTLPFSVVIDRDGRIHETIEGVLFPEEFDEKVKPLLKPLHK